LLAVALGFFLGQIVWMSANAAAFITPFIMAVLFGVLAVFYYRVRK
jgi:hypothetical protein